MTLTAPNRKPQQFGFAKGDSHLVVNSATKRITAYDFSGNELWTRPCLADGQHPNWRNKTGDTPPGLYKVGAIYNDYQSRGNSPAFSRVLMAFGWLSLDMIDLEGNEDRNGRAGIMLHGGGSGNGWPGAWAPLQVLYPTLGCLRMHNRHLVEDVLPLVQRGTTFISVYQDEV
jgi:hypothetical protein